MLSMTNKRFTEPNLAHLVARAHAHTVVRWTGSDAPGIRSLTSIVADTLPPASRPLGRPGSFDPDISDDGRQLGEGFGAQQALPSWAAMINATLLSAGRVAWDWLEADLTHPPRPLDPAAPLAFGEVLLPFVYAARQTLYEQVGSAYALLDTATHRVLERSLLARLARLCHSALEEAYLAFRTQPRLDLARLVSPSDDPVTALYSTFVMDMLWGELLPFFTREPLLARQAALLTESWVTLVAALLHDLSKSDGPGSRPVITLA